MGTQNSNLIGKIILRWLLVVVVSCEYKDIGPRICYLASEQTSSKVNFYTYDDDNELVSYLATNVFSSIITNDGAGKIISELDNGNIHVDYTYDQSNRLVLWTETIDTNPSRNSQVKFMYNDVGQDTLKQVYKYDVSSSSYYLWFYTSLSYSSPGNKNYSQRRTYDDLSTLIFTEKFLWDNHHNPYLTNPFFTNEPPPSNNVLQYELTFVGHIPSVVNYSYEYNSNGFPLSQTEIGNGPVAYYTYTNCN